MRVSLVPLWILAVLCLGCSDAGRDDDGGGFPGGDENGDGTGGGDGGDDGGGEPPGEEEDEGDFRVPRASGGTSTARARTPTRSR